MGEVYRARDSKLQRYVAIKVLPAAFTADRERLARFEREAQLLAQLHHPNIASVFGLEESSGVRALVMELADGEDLSTRIARGPIPLDEALPIAMQIAEALEAAHEHGIIHRDLKPANVKVRADGAVKVLDFGLAKALTPDGASAATNTAIEHSPTLTARATQLGTILGTAAYMAPEQARGKAVDCRADIWAFGVVLYEMLTGRRAFTGEDTSDVLAAVLRQEMDWGALPTNTPAPLRRLLERCLDRDPKQRLRDIGEARVVLSKAESLEPSGLPAPSPAVVTSRYPRFWIAVAAGCLLTGVALGTLGTALLRDASPVPTNPPVRTLIIPAAGRTLEDRQAISPDGKWIAYTAAGSLWIRNLSELEPREVRGSAGRTSTVLVAPERCRRLRSARHALQGFGRWRTARGVVQDHRRGLHGRVLERLAGSRVHVISRKLEWRGHACVRGWRNARAIHPGRRQERGAASRRPPLPAGRPQSPLHDRHIRLQRRRDRRRA